jgi:hypothetical protein
MPFRRKLLNGPGVTFPTVPAVDPRAPAPSGADAAKVSPSLDRRFQLGLPVKMEQDVVLRPSPRALAGPASKKGNGAPDGIVLVPVIHETLTLAMACTGVTDAGELVELALQQLAARHR